MTAMKERPILFSGAMVRAILDGNKTQTRRLVKPMRGYEHNNVCRPDLAADAHVVWWHGESERVGVLQACPYGAPGDRLWGKETWRTSLCCDDRAPSTMEVPGGGYGWPIWYAADGGALVTWRGAKAGGPGFTTPGKTRVSIHMPRWASRITLEITEVRVQRLQDISEGDARAEGVEQCGGFMASAGCWTNYGADGPSRDTARDSFHTLWDSINGDRAPWASSPWVWAITFKRVESEVSR